MNIKVEKKLIDLIIKYPELKTLEKDILLAYEMLKKSFSLKGILLIAGNGGSSCDSGHIVGELMKGFIKKRKIGKDERIKIDSIENEKQEYLYENLQEAFKAIDLTAQQGLISAISNDNDAEMIYAQQVWGYGEKKDIFLGLSTSGNSENIILAGIVAKMKGMKTIGFSGSKASKMDEVFDIVLKVPTDITYQVQELHLPIYHTLCQMLEEEFFN